MNFHTPVKRARKEIDMTPTLHNSLHYGVMKRYFHLCIQYEREIKHFEEEKSAPAVDRYALTILLKEANDRLEAYGKVVIASTEFLETAKRNNPEAHALDQWLFAFAKGELKKEDE